MNKFISLALLVLLSCNDNQHNQKKINLDFIDNYRGNTINGKKIFYKSCVTCHLYGSAGATTLSDKTEWEYLLKNKNKKEIFINVYNGFAGTKGAMPKMGGCYNCSELDLFDAIEYILSINGLTITN